MPILLETFIYCNSDTPKFDPWVSRFVLSRESRPQLLTCNRVLKPSMSFSRATRIKSRLLLTVTIALLVCVAFLGQHGNSYARPSQTKKVQTWMFLDAADRVEYVKRCGHDWMEIVSRWERLQRRALDGCRDTKAIIWKCDGNCGGLGDRQRGILTSFMLALVIGRAFFIQNDIPVPLQHYFHVANPHLRWTLEESHLEGRTVLHENFLNDWPSIGDYTTANLSHYDSYDFVIQFNNHWQPFQILRNPLTPVWARKLRQYDDHVLAGCLLNYLLVPARSLQDDLHQVRQAVAVHNQRLLAVQIRTGDNQIKNTTVLTDFIQLFQTCIQKLQRFSPVPFQVFLTTDSDEALQVFQAAYPSLLTFSGDIYHVDGRFGAPADPDAAFRKLVLDHLLISQADEVLISRSGFSEYAVLRGFKSYYTPANCIPGKPIPHFMMPTSQPAPGSVDAIHSLDVMLNGA